LTRIFKGLGFGRGPVQIGTKSKMEISGSAQGSSRELEA